MTPVYKTLNLVTVGQQVFLTFKLSFEMMLFEVPLSKDVSETPFLLINMDLILPFICFDMFNLRT